MLLDTLLPPAEAAGRIGTVIEISALRALTLWALDDVDRALEALKRALQLAEPEGYARVFIDEGEPMAHLLRQVASRGIALNYVGQLLAVLETRTVDQRAIDVSSLVESLSGREIQALELLADGLSNSEIAQRLLIRCRLSNHTRAISTASLASTTERRQSPRPGRWAFCLSSSFSGKTRSRDFLIAL